MHTPGTAGCYNRKPRATSAGVGHPEMGGNPVESSVITTLFDPSRPGKSNQQGTAWPTAGWTTTKGIPFSRMCGILSGILSLLGLNTRSTAKS